MDLGQKTRRRGDELEAAILDAAWAQLEEAGYSSFTYEAIAARAGTSRPVLYRRYPTRDDLLIAAMDHGGALSMVNRPDTGSLREDAVTLLNDVNRVRAGFAALLSVRAAEYYSETGTTLREVRARMLGGNARSGFQVIVEQAAARGEVDVDRVPRRVIDMPMDLFRNELMMNMARVPDETVTEIVDELWLPLLRTYGAKV